MSLITPARLMTCLVLTFTVVGIVQAAGLFQQNLLFTKAQTEVSFWGRPNYQPDEVVIERTQRQLDTLLLANPDHPDYLALQANAAVWLAYWKGEAGQQAINSQTASLQSRPAHSHSWMKLVEYLSRGDARARNLALAAQAQTRLSALSVKATP